MKKQFLNSLAGLALAFVATGSFAFPEKPIEIIVPWPPGTETDVGTRALAGAMSKKLNVPIQVINKPGAGGTIAMAELARAPADGYTIAYASQGTLVFNQALYQRPGYDSLKDFAPIYLVGGVTNVMVVPPNSTSNTVLDVVAAAKAKPGHLTFSSGGSGTSHHLSGVVFGQMTGTDVLHVPYKGAPQGIVAVMSGEVSMGFFNMPTVINQIKSGKLKALGVTSLERSTLMPQVPTLDASGVKGYEVNTWLGFMAPAGVPADVLNRLHAQIGKILSQAAVKEVLAAQGFDLAPLQPSAVLTTLIRDDLAKWPPIIKAAGATVD